MIYEVRFGFKDRNQTDIVLKNRYMAKEKAASGRQLFLELLTLKIISVLRSLLLYPCAR